jgi:hypothetical protein
MVRVRLNGKPYECTLGYGELKTVQYIRLFKDWDLDKDAADRDYFKLFSIFTGSKFGAFSQTPENEAAIWSCVRWFVEEPFDPPKVNFIEIDGKKLDLKDPGHLSIGQNIHLRRIIESSKYIQENIAIAIAIYLQPQYDVDKFDIEKARILEKKILDLPIYSTYNMGFFLLNQTLNYGYKRGNVLSLIRHSHIKMSRQMLHLWRRYIYSIRLKI